MPNEVRFTRAELAEADSPHDHIREKLMDAGCPLDNAGNLDPDVQGYSSWTLDTDELVISWEEESHGDD